MNARTLHSRGAVAQRASVSLVGRIPKFERSKPPSGRSPHRIHVRLFRITQANTGGELVDSIPDNCVVLVGGVEVVNGMPVSFILSCV